MLEPLSGRSRCRPGSTRRRASAVASPAPRRAAASLSSLPFPPPPSPPTTRISRSPTWCRCARGRIAPSSASLALPELYARGRSASTQTHPSISPSPTAASPMETSTPATTTRSTTRIETMKRVRRLPRPLHHERLHLRHRRGNPIRHGRPLHLDTHRSLRQLLDRHRLSWGCLRERVELRECRWSPE